MQLLKDRIIRDGVVKEGNILKVDAFLNHQIDVELLEAMAKEFKKEFEDCNVNKVLTIEASGIAIATEVAKEFGVPLLFAKKSKTKNIAGDVYTAKVMSYTHGREYDIMVSKNFLTESDRVLIIDDFLAKGEALKGLISLVDQAKAKLCGCGIAIEKGFQGGGDKLRSEGIKVCSLAIVESMDAENSHIVFRD